MALKKVHMGASITQQKMQSVNKEASYMRNFDCKYLVKSFYSFFDTERVQVKYQQQNTVFYRYENHWTFCILMEYAEGGDLQLLIEKHKKMKTHIAEDKIWHVSQ